MLPLLAFLVLQTPALDVTASVDRDRVAVGETVVLTVKATGHSTAAFRVDLPPIDGFALVERRERTDVAIAREVTRAYTLELELRAELVGTWDLGPFRVEQGDLSAFSPAASVTVVNASAGSSPGLEADMLALIPRVPAPRPFGPSVFVLTSDDLVFAGDQVNVLTAAWLPRGLRLRLRQPPSLTPPALPGVFSTPRASVPGAVASRVVDGETYDLFVAFQTVYPLNPGSVVIPAARLSWVQPSGRPSTGDDRRQSVESSPTTLVVRDLPVAGRPQDFDGPVARDLAVEYRLAQSSARAGAVLQVDVVVSGAGNLQLWPAPRVPWPADARVYEEETESSLRTVGQRLGGSKRFRYAVVPDSAGSLSLPPLDYPYFDPGSGAYKEARAPGILVPVLEAAPVGERGTPIPIERMGPAPFAERITGLEPRLLAGLVAAPLLVMALVALLRVRPRRRRAPAPIGNPADRLERLVQSLARTAGGATPRALVAALRQAGVEREEAERLIALHGSLEAERFGAAGTGRATPELLHAIDALLARIPPQLRRLAGVGAVLLLLGHRTASAQSGTELYLRGEYAAAAHAFRVEATRNAPNDAWYDLAAAEYMARHDPQAVAALLMARARAPRNRHVEALWNALAREHEQLRSAGARWPFSAEEALAAALLLLWLAAVMFALPGRRRTLWIAVLVLSGTAALVGFSLRADRAMPRAVLVGGSSLRVSPHGLAPERGTVLPFSVVRLVRRQGGWWLVETFDNAIGWVPADILAPVPALD
jgi:hypothetical protein